MVRVFGMGKVGVLLDMRMRISDGWMDGWM